MRLRVRSLPLLSGLLWLWRRPVATALIQPLAWEPPYAAGAAQEMAKRQNTKTNNKKTTVSGGYSLGGGEREWWGGGERVG